MDGGIAIILLTMHINKSLRKRCLDQFQWRHLWCVYPQDLPPSHYPPSSIIQENVALNYKALKAILLIQEKKLHNKLCTVFIKILQVKPQPKLIHDHKINIMNHRDRIQEDKDIHKWPTKAHPELIVMVKSHLDNFMTWLLIKNQQAQK